MLNSYDEFNEAIQDANCNMTAQVKIYVYDDRSNFKVKLDDGTHFKVNSVELSEKASSNTDFCVGGCCIGTFDFTLTQKGCTVLQDEGLLRKGVILKPRFSVRDSDDDKLTCKLGCFIITDLDNDDYSCAVKSSSYMLLFDKEVTNTDLEEIRSMRKDVIGWLEYCCSKCSTDSVALEVADISVTTNIDIQVTLPDDKDITTFRDLIGWLSVFTASFATIDRNGNLVLRQYQTDSSDYIVPASSTYLNSKFDMMTTKVSGYTTSVAGFDKCYDDNSITDCNRVTLSIEEIPFLRELHPYDCTSLDSTVSEYIDNIYNAVKDLEFVGGTVVYSGNPAIELGDTVKVKRIVHQTNSDSGERESAMMLVSEYTWRFQGSTTIKCTSVTDGVVRKITSSKKETPKNDGVSQDDLNSTLSDIASNLGTVYPDKDGNIYLNANPTIRDISYYLTDANCQSGRCDATVQVPYILVSSCECVVPFPATKENYRVGITFNGTVSVSASQLSKTGASITVTTNKTEFKEAKSYNVTADVGIIVGSKLKLELLMDGSVVKEQESRVAWDTYDDTSSPELSMSMINFTTFTKMSSGSRKFILNIYTDLSVDLHFSYKSPTNDLVLVDSDSVSSILNSFDVDISTINCKALLKVDGASELFNRVENSGSDKLSAVISSKADNSNLILTQQQIVDLLSKVHSLEKRVAQLEGRQS